MLSFKYDLYFEFVAVQIFFTGKSNPQQVAQCLGRIIMITRIASCEHNKKITLQNLLEAHPYS